MKTIITLTLVLFTLGCSERYRLEQDLKPYRKLQVLTYKDNPVTEHLVPSDPKCPAIAVRVGGDGPTCQWSVREQKWK